MWAAIRTLRLFAKSLTRIAVALEQLRDLYQLDLATRGIVPTDVTIHDEVEVAYGSMDREPDV